MSGQRPIRVLMLLTPGVSFCEDWARAAATVADVTTVTMAGAPIFRREHSYLPAAPVVRTRRLRPNRALRGVNEWLKLRDLDSWIRSRGPDQQPFDLVHTHFYSGAGFMPSFKRKTGTPFVITEHSSRLTGQSSKHKPLSAAGMRIARSIYREASRVIVPSEYLASCIVRSGLCARSDVTIVGDPVDVTLFRPFTAAPGDDLRVVSVGRLEDDKDPFLLLDAFALALEKEDRLRLELIGDGPGSKSVRRYVSERGLEGRVTLHGRIPNPQVAERLRGAALFSLASRVETFCVAALEAVASGVPVVLPAVGALPDLIDHTRGVVVNRRDRQALAAGILEVVRNRSRFDPAAMASFVAERYSYEAVGSQLADVYQAAIRANARVPLLRS